MIETMTVTPTQEAPKAAPKKAKTAKPSKNGEAKGLRPLQVKVLKTLLRNKSPLSRTQLYAKLGFKTNSGLNDVLGKNDPKTRAKADKEKYPCLLTLGMVRLIEVPSEALDGATAERVYEITAAGKKAAQKAD